MAHSRIFEVTAADFGRGCDVRDFGYNVEVTANASGHFDYLATDDNCDLEMEGTGHDMFDALSAGVADIHSARCEPCHY